MSLFEVSLFLHITAVVVGFGSTFAESIAFPVAMKLDPRHLPYVHALQLAINRRFATPALVVVLVTGLYQVDEAGYSFGDAWVSASFLILIVIGGLLGGYFVPDRPAPARDGAGRGRRGRRRSRRRCRRTTSARRASRGWSARSPASCSCSRSS